MFHLLLFLCFSLEVIQFTEGQVSDIKSEFKEGNAHFAWTNLPHTKKEEVYVTLNGANHSHDLKVFGEYIQQDVLNFTTVGIFVRTYLKNGTVCDSEYNRLNQPKVIQVTKGGDIIIEIPIDFVPATGSYSIQNSFKSTKLFEVNGDDVKTTEPAKYKFVGKSDKSITIRIMTATNEDAGYLWTGTQYNRNGPGVVLVVKGSPTQPTITSKVGVQVGENVTLTCKSKSTSTPSYYKMLPLLTYIWYRNDSGFTWRSSNQWSFRVEKRHKYDTITCVSREEFNSFLSEPFRINLQYGPDTVIISPEIQETVDIIQGRNFGPYTCSADCSPPCRYQWQRLISGSQYDDVGTGPTFTILQTDKSHANKYRCQVDSDFNNSYGSTKATKSVILRVLRRNASLSTISVVGMILGVVLAICLAISIVVWNRCRNKRVFEKGFQKGVQVSATKNEDDIANQRLPVENFTDHNEYDMIDEGINCQNIQIESAIGPKREKYQDFLGVIKVEGTSQKNLQMAQYENKPGYVGKTSTSETVDIGKNDYESTHLIDDQSSRLYTDLSRDDKSQGSLYTTLSTDGEPRSSLYTALSTDGEPQSSLYTALSTDGEPQNSLYTAPSTVDESQSDHQPRGSMYSSLSPNDEQKGSLYTSLHPDDEPKYI